MKRRTRWGCHVLFAALWMLALPGTGRAHADTYDEVLRRGELIWGGDQEGGGPYVYPDPSDPTRVTGFEVDLAGLLAAELGVKARFFQADWNTLPEFLETGKIDIILNGYEETPERSARMAATRPYYIYELQLLARASDTRIRNWEDLRRLAEGRRPQVSVLGGSAAARYLNETWADVVDIVEYDGNTNAMMQVGANVHDATLQDLPIAVFYRALPAGKGLRFVGDPVAPGYYVIYARKTDRRLVDALNATIEKAGRDGRLRAIYERYGLWNQTQEKLLTAAVTGEAGEGPVGGPEVIRRYGPILLRAAGTTVLLACASMPLAIALGLGVALGRLYGPAVLRPVLTVYVEVLRGTPVMLQLFVIFFLLPRLLDVSLSPYVAAVAGLAINYSAYESEIYRAGLQAVPRGQVEAALALGMTRRTALRRVVVPQAVRMVVPPVTNDFIALFKDTSICSVIAVTELTKQYNMLANSTGAILELAVMTAVLYLTMSYPLSVLTRRMEQRLATDARAIGV